MPGINPIGGIALVGSRQLYDLTLSISNERIMTVHMDPSTPESTSLTAGLNHPWAMFNFLYCVYDTSRARGGRSHVADMFPKVQWHKGASSSETITRDMLQYKQPHDRTAVQDDHQIPGISNFPVVPRFPAEKCRHCISSFI